MPRFYIDSDDGSVFVLDEDGAEYRDLASAEDEAMRALPEIAQSFGAAQDWRQVSTTVRDEAGNVLFRASLALTVVRAQARSSSRDRAAA